MPGVEIMKYECFFLYNAWALRRPVLHLSVSAVSYKVPSGAAVRCTNTRIDPLKDAIGHCPLWSTGSSKTSACQ